MLHRLQRRLAFAVLFVGLFMLAFIGSVLISPPGRDASEPTTIRAVSNLAAIISAIGLFITAVIIAVPVALRPANRVRRLISVLPICVLGVLLCAVFANILQIGTLGTLRYVRGLVFTPTGAAVVGSAAMAVITIAIITFGVKLNNATIRLALTALSVTLVPTLIAAVLVVGVAVISFSRPIASDKQDASQMQPDQTNMQGMEGMAPAAPRGPSRSFAVVAILAAVLVSLAILSAVSGVRTLRIIPKELSDETMPIVYRHEVGAALGTIAMVSLAFLVVLQFVPVDRANPAVQANIHWDSPQTQQLWDNACADCHSNSTKWPWYSYVAPASWLLSFHVKDGRDHFNLSYLDSLSPELAAQFPPKARDQVNSGAMPPPDYLILHPEARLSDAEKQALIEGLLRTLGS